MKDNDWELLAQQWQQQALPPADDIRILEAGLRQYRQAHQKRQRAEWLALAGIAGLLAWALLSKPGYALLLGGLTLLLLLWQGGLWWLRRHWRLNHASTGLRQMLQADLRLARYRLLYHGLGMPVGALMLVWALPQLPLPSEAVLAGVWLVAVIAGSVGYSLWAGRRAWRRMGRMREQLQQLDGRVD